MLPAAPTIALNNCGEGATVTRTKEDTSAVDPQDRDIQGRRIASPTAEARAGARTPEELETLFEDTLVLRDRQALAELFEDGAVLVASDERSARGGEEIARLALATWIGDHTYVADLRRVVQARDIALIVAERGINVARRGSDGSWRYAIVRQSVDDGLMMEFERR
jgi:hypothetical protein